MGNEKFVNYYIENLIATMNDCLIRNISLQVNERISKENIEEQVKAINELKNTSSIPYTHKSSFHHDIILVIFFV